MTPNGHLSKYVKEIIFKRGKHWSEVCVTYANDKQENYEALIDYERPIAVNIYTSRLAKPTWSKSAIREFRNIIDGELQ